MLSRLPLTGRLTLMMVLAVFCAFPRSGFSQDGTDPVVGVRVFWEIKLLHPDTSKGSPQIITVLTPDGTVDHAHHVFEINHSTAPDSRRGGLQGQFWHGESLVKWTDAVKPGVALDTSAETIRFEQCMTLRDVTAADGSTARHLVFCIENLSSSTWGELPSVGAVEASTTLQSLAAFDVKACLTESAILVGRNRVDYMKVGRIELVRATGATAGRTTDYFLKAPKTATP